MKIPALFFCCLLALASCNQKETNDQAATESKLEEAAAEVYDETVEKTSPNPDSAGSTADPTLDEGLPGATSTASTPPSATNPLFNLTLHKGQAGAVTIGMTIDKVRELYGLNKVQEIQLSQEGMTTTAYELLGERRRPDLRLEQECTGTACKVSRITVLNPAFKTPEGVGIGSTFGTVKEAFQVSSVGIGEDNFVAIVKNQNMSFILDMSAIPSSRWTKLKVKDIPPATPVIGILIY
ncbi:hypothetical protein [Rufibacter sp. LB8]|uniref:hypothetical protein n=1 Tax=Rufibacter sp. LB8 TaxID=2777781 RepID=UPI00178C38BF|nr:hypothetical protein [Rufibacter sp. LB8]